LQPRRGPSASHIPRVRNGMDAGLNDTDIGTSLKPQAQTKPFSTKAKKAARRRAALLKEEVGKRAPTSLFSWSQYADPMLAR